MKKKNGVKKNWGAEITKWVIQKGFYEARLRHHTEEEAYYRNHPHPTPFFEAHREAHDVIAQHLLAEKRYAEGRIRFAENMYCLLYTSPSPRDRQKSRMPSSA